MAELKLINMGDVVAEQIKYLWYPYIAYGKIPSYRAIPATAKRP